MRTQTHAKTFSAAPASVDGWVFNGMQGFDLSGIPELLNAGITAR